MPVKKLLNGAGLFFFSTVIALIHMLILSFCSSLGSLQLLKESIMCSVLLFQNKCEFFCLFSVMPRVCNKDKRYFSTAIRSMVKEMFS